MFKRMAAAHAHDVLRNGGSLDSADDRGDQALEYATVRRRLGACLIDWTAFLLLAAFTFRLGQVNSLAAVATTIVQFVAVHAYHVIFVAKLGATPGKLLLGLRIVQVDGTPVGWSGAFRRSSVDIVLGMVLVAARIPALWNVSPQHYAALKSTVRASLRDSSSAAWYEPFSYVSGVWAWADLVALFTNRQRRALHDFIAGTVVVRLRSQNKRIEPTPEDTLT